MTALWAEAIRSGKSQYWVARQYERQLGVRALSADTVRAARAIRPAASSRTR